MRDVVAHLIWATLVAVACLLVFAALWYVFVPSTESVTSIMQTDPAPVHPYPNTTSK
jgi:hypothetical protein